MARLKEKQVANTELVKCCNNPVLVAMERDHGSWENAKSGLLPLKTLHVSPSI